MAILDLKSNLSQWRKPTTVESGEKKKLSESPIKAVYSTSNELKTPTDIKINKVDNSTSIQVPGAKKIDYKLFSINGKRNRGIPAISTLFGDKLLPKVSEYKEQRVKELVKASEFIKITPRGIQHISTIEILKTILKDKISKYKDQFPRNLTKTSLYKDQLPINILKLSLYKDQLPINILKLSLYKDQLPAIIDKLSLYKDQLPPLLDKLSLYKDQSPRALLKLSLYKDQRPNILDKLSLYKKLAANGFDNLQSGARGFTLYQTATQYLGLDTSALEYIYPKTVKFGRLKDRVSFTGRGLSGFNDLESGAIGFTEYQAVTQYLGVNTIAGTYTYPNTVKLGNILNRSTFYSDSKYGLLLDGKERIFDGVLAGTKFERIYNTDKNPYTDKNRFLTNISNSLRTYAETRRSPSPLDWIYTKFNLQTASWNPFSFGPAFNQPLILRGIQRERKGSAQNPERQGPQSWGFENNFDDGLMRGGIVGSTERAIFDTLRIGKWMASPRGLLFIVKQAGLQAAAPITEADPFVGARAGNGALTLISSLANTATQHLGIRFRKDAFPFIPRRTYSTVMFGNDSHGRGINRISQTIVNNRLANLRDTLLDFKSPIISTGPGGPQSVYGIGSTNIRRAVNSVDNLSYLTNTGVRKNIIDNDYSYLIKYATRPYDLRPGINQNIEKQDGISFITGPNYILGVQNPNNTNFRVTNYSNTSDINGNYYTLTYENLLDRKTQIDEKSTTIYNFLLNVDGTAKNPNATWIPTQGSFGKGIVIQNYTKTSQHIRTKLSVPEYGKRGKNLQNPLKGDFMSKYTPGGNGMIDPIWKINQTDEEAVDDFIKFMFHDLNTNERFRFRAYIENVSEDFSPNWQEVKILGRADSPYIYQGFERSLSISFKAAALSRGDLMLMWDQLERLAKTTVPKYDNTYKMKGPLIKFTLGNWFINTPAFIKSLSYTVDNETPWEINLSDTGIYRGENKEYNVGELPMIVSVQVSMQIFGEVRPASTHTQAEPGGITSSTHYGAGHLYPLGINKLRTKRQTALLGNDNLADPEDEVVTTIAARPLTPIDVNLPEPTGPSAPAPRR
jgi:hypothetical protein